MPQSGSYPYIAASITGMSKRKAEYGRADRELARGRIERSLLRRLHKAGGKVFLVSLDL